MARYPVCTTDDVPDGGRHIKEVADREIAIFAIDGHYHAVANYCVHAGGPVCTGRLSGMVTGTAGEWDRGWDRDGRILACPWHGWEFDIETGEFLSDSRYRLITYEVAVEDNVIYVDVGGNPGGDD